MASKLQAARVPLVVVSVPMRPQAALVDSPQWPPHVDPFAFDRQVETIASKHGVGYLDLIQTFSRFPNSENLFFVVDWHVNSDGQQVIAQNLVQKLQDGNVPAFSQCDLQASTVRER
jgi:hypothetical protein